VNGASDIAGWVQSGSLLAFAGAVLWELRQQRNERNQQNKMLTALLHDLNTALSILLDRSGVKPRKPTNPAIPTITSEGESQ
jgi:hypothetical protein